MLQIHDIREGRFYQEVREEVLKEGIEKGIAIARMAASKMDAVEIAANLKMDVEEVRKALAMASQK